MEKDDLKKEIINRILQERKIGELIYYEEFQKLHEKYGKGLSEKDFAKILYITYPNYMSLKSDGKRARILNNKKLIADIGQEIIQRVMQERAMGELINYAELHELYNKYGQCLFEKDFARILGIADATYKILKEPRVRILPPEIDTDEQQIKKKVMKERAIGELIDYTEFQELHKKYGEGLPEKDFAIILDLSKSQYNALKNMRKKARILKGQEISEDEKQCIIQSVMEETGKGKSINYIEFQILHRKYGRVLIEKDFAELLGISYESFKDIKNRGLRAKILKPKKIIEGKEQKNEENKQKESKKELVNYDKIQVEKNKEEVKRLIEQGKFDLELIAFEYNIPLDTILKWKKELEVEKTTKQEIDESVIKKIEEIEIRYRKLVLGKSGKEQLDTKQLSQKEIEFVAKSLAIMRENYNKFIKANSIKEKIKLARSIELTFSKLEKFELSMEQAEECISIIYSIDFEELCSREKDPQLQLKMKDARRHASNQLAKAIDSRINETEEIGEIENLKSRILPKLVKESFLLASVKAKAQNKIQKIKQADVINKIRYNISSDVESIIIDLANGILDIDKANSIIEEEVNKRIKNRPQNGLFLVTRAQEMRQILIQIKTAIREQVDKYTIKNPELAIEQMQQLFGGPIEDAVAVVVEQEIKLKEFTKARDICSKITKGTPETAKCISGLLKQINSAEIINVILKFLQGEATEDEKEKYYKIIEEELKMEKSTAGIRLGKIYLGKSKDGKKITFADIWSDEKVRSFDR